MKSRTGIILLIFIFLFTGVAALAEGNQSTKKEDSAEKEEVVNLFQIEEELGIKVDFPAAINIDKISIYNKDEGIIEFTYKDQKYTFTFKKGEKEENLTGLTFKNPIKRTTLTDKGCYYLEYEKDGQAFTYWLNEENSLVCSLLSEEKANLDNIKKVTEMIIEVQ